MTNGLTVVCLQVKDGAKPVVPSTVTICSRCETQDSGNNWFEK
jgi:hypothetical protein